MKESLFEYSQKIMEECLGIMKRKNADYADSNDALKNFNLVESFDICSREKGICVRLCDKFSRIVNLLEKEGQVKDESFEDTIRDAINYLAILSYARKVKKESEND